MKGKVAADAWNSRDPERTSLAYTEDSEWRNRDEFLKDREEIKAFLTRKRKKETGYKLKKYWAHSINRITVRFEHMSDDADGH